MKKFAPRGISFVRRSNATNSPSLMPKRRENIDQIRVAMQSIDKVQMAQDDFRTRHNFYVIPQA